MFLLLLYMFWLLFVFIIVFDLRIFLVDLEKFFLEFLLEIVSLLVYLFFFIRKDLEFLLLVLFFKGLVFLCE